MRTLMILLALCVPPTASGQITFERAYGGSQDDWGRSVAQTDDGRYIVAGYTESFAAGAWDVYLIKTDASGDTVWTRTYGGSSYDGGHSVGQTTDGGYIIAGYTQSFGAGSSDFYLIKTDALGDTAWTRTYGGSDWDVGYSVEQTLNGGYIIAGATDSFGAGSSDFYLIKTDATGDTVWTRIYGGSSYDGGHSVGQTTDGGYIIAGYTQSFGAGSSDFYLIKTDALGDTAWTRTYGGSHRDEANSVAQTDDGGYIIAGDTESFGAGSYDVYLVKTDGAGDTAWTRTYGGLNDDRGHSVEPTGDGGYIIAGRTDSFGAGWQDIYLIKTDASGDTAWTRTYGGLDYDGASSVRQTSDGGYIITGYTISFGAGYHDVYLIKTDADGLVQVSDDDKKTPRPHLSYLAQNYPNPFRETTAITYALPDNRHIALSVYDIRGALVRKLASGTASEGQHRIVWDGRDGRGQRVSSGVYFCHLEAGDHIETKRMVLLR